MCRNIRTLFNFEPPATEEEVRAASLQFVRKLSGFNKPSRANEPAFKAAQVSAPARTSPRFSARVVSVIRSGKILGIRAGTQPHRIIGIWAVVVEGRVFVRSWSLKPRSWWRTFLEEPRGVIEVEGRQIAVRAVQTRSERLKAAVSRAYIEKYDTPGSVKYARDLGRARSRKTTTELVPLPRR